MPRTGFSSIVISAALLLTSAAASLLPAAASAACFPETFPSRWLADQERLGGHTLGLHVGKTDQQLMDRLNQDKRLHEESSFSTREVAVRSAEAALRRNRASIEAWAAKAKPKQRHAWHFHTEEVVGRGAVRPVNLTHIEDRTGVTAVVMKTSDGNCLLYTAYPSR